MSDPKIIQLSGDGEFNMDVRGESHYQDALALLTSGRKRKDARTVKVARLIPDPTNPVDTNAVRVEIEDHLVGFLPKYLAPAYLSTLKKRKITGVIECPALIRGGFERDGELFPFGVRLDLPDALISDIAANTKEPTAKKKGGGCLKWGLIGLGVFILIGIIGSFAPRDEVNSVAEGVTPVPTFTSTPMAVATIAPTAPLATAQPIDAVSDYRTAVLEQSRELSEGIQRITTSMQDPQLTEQSWILDMGMGIAQVEIAREELDKIEPPADMAAFHEQLAGAAATCNEFARTLGRAIDDRSSSGIDTSVELMNRCTDQLLSAAVSFSE